MNYTEKQIEKLAEEYADKVNDCWNNDYQGFLNGFKKAMQLAKNNESLHFVGKSFYCTSRLLKADDIEGCEEQCDSCKRCSSI